jgi:hypothetical protein
MHGAGEAMDLVTVANYLDQKGQLEAAGGAAYIAQLVDGVPRVSNVAHYARIVKEKALLRRLIYQGEALKEAAFDPCADLDALTARLAGVAALCTGPVPTGLKRFRNAEEILTAEKAAVDCIVEPYLARGCVTDLVGKVKSAGKTTMAVDWVASVLDGRPILGRPTRKCPAVYLSEAPAASFIPAMERAGIGQRPDFVVGFWNELADLSWDAIVKGAVEEAKRIGAGLLVVDTFSQFAGLAAEGENDSGAGLLAMRPLQLAAATANLAVLVLRHERKSGGAIAEAGRGSSAISGAVDVILSLRRPEGHSNGRVRLLEAIGRLPDLPSDALVIELTESGYVLQGSRQDLAIAAARDAIVSFFVSLSSDCVGQKSLKEIAEACKLRRSSAQRAVENLRAEGFLDVTGNGKRGDPYMYCVSAQHQFLCWEH